MREFTACPAHRDTPHDQAVSNYHLRVEHPKGMDVVPGAGGCCGLNERCSPQAHVFGHLVD